MTSIDNKKSSHRSRIVLLSRDVEYRCRLIDFRNAKIEIDPFKIGEKVRFSWEKMNDFDGNEIHSQDSRVPLLP